MYEVGIFEVIMKADITGLPLSVLMMIQIHVMEIIFFHVSFFSSLRIIAYFCVKSLTLLIY